MRLFLHMLINQRLYFSRELESRDVYRIGLQIIDLVQQYKYLDILFEYLKFEPFCRSSCSRALPLFISNFSVKHVVIMYLKCNRIQHRTMRFFLVAHKYTPIHVLHWDIEWFPLFSIDRSASIVRFWNRLNNMSNDRLTKTVCFVALTIMLNNILHKYHPSDISRHCWRWFQKRMQICQQNSLSAQMLQVKSMCSI